MAGLGFGFALSLLPAVNGEDRESYIQQVEQWRSERENRLRDPYGWLTLVGLHWLQQGDNSFGSGAANHVALPPGKTPGHAGLFVVDGDRVTVKVAPGVPVMHKGQPVATMALKTDAQGEPTLLQLGSLRFHVIERGERLGVRVKDRESAVLRNFTGIDYYAIDPRWRFEARFEPYDPPKELRIPNILGTIDTEPSPGAVVFEAEGMAYRLDAVGAGDALFIIFGDDTNGSGTYGGGRFLYADLPTETGRVVLDFNKAYNPPCVFTPYSTCPLPPRQNKLPFAVHAGEKAYARAAH